MKSLSLKDVLMQTMIAAIYVVLVFVFQFLSFETIQFRIAEVLLVLIYFNKKNAMGLILGTFVANLLFSPFGLVDAMFGTLATILALLLMAILSKPTWLSLLMPALANALVIGLMISFMDQIPFIPIASWVFLGEAAVMLIMGLPSYQYLKKHPHFIEIMGS